MLLRLGKRPCQVSATLQLEQRPEATPSLPSLDGLRISSLDVVGETFAVQNSTAAGLSLAGWTVKSSVGAIYTHKPEAVVNLMSTGCQSGVIVDSFGIPHG